MNRNNVLILVLVLAGVPHMLFAQDSATPGLNFSDSERATFLWISNSNAVNGLAMIAVGVSIPMGVFVSPGTAIWVGFTATIVQAATIASTAIGYSVLDSALAREGKDALRPGAPIVWSYVSLGSFVAALLTSLLVPYLAATTGVLPGVLGAAFFLTGEISAVVTFFGTSGYMEMIRQREQGSGPDKAKWVPAVPPPPALYAAAFSAPTGVRVRIPLLSLRY